MLSSLRHQTFAGLRVLLLFTLFLGLAYPLAVTGIARVAFAEQAGGSLVRDGALVGSSLIGQTFDGDEWFHSRPSAAGGGYDPLASGASNLGPESEDLLDTVRKRREAVADRERIDISAVPPEAVAASGSGLDPHISPDYAHLQVSRVAHARGLDAALVRALVDEHRQGRVLGVLGDPRVNVLQLNVALGKLAG